MSINLSNLAEEIQESSVLYNRQKLPPRPPKITYNMTLSPSSFALLPMELHLQISTELHDRDIINLTSLCPFHSVGYIYEDILISRIAPELLKMGPPPNSAESKEAGSYYSAGFKNSDTPQLLVLPDIPHTIHRILDFYYSYFPESNIVLPFRLLEHALIKKRNEVVRLLCERLGPERLNSTVETHHCLYTSTILANKLHEGLEILIEYGYDVVTKRKTLPYIGKSKEHICTPLHQAVRSGSKEIVSLVLRAGKGKIDVEEMDSNGQTAIGVATSLWLLNPSEFVIPWYREWETFRRRVEVIDVLLSEGGARLDKAGENSILERAWNDTRSELGRNERLSAYFKVFVERMLPLLRMRGLVVTLDHVKALKQRGEGEGPCVDWEVISGKKRGDGDVGEKTLRMFVKTLLSEEAVDTMKSSKEMT